VNGQVGKREDGGRNGTQRKKRKHANSEIHEGSTPGSVTNNRSAINASLQRFNVSLAQLFRCDSDHGHSQGFPGCDTCAVFQIPSKQNGRATQAAV
jgi:hypothetical protein